MVGGQTAYRPLGRTALRLTALSGPPSTKFIGKHLHIQLHALEKLTENKSISQHAIIHCRSISAVQSSTEIVHQHALEQSCVLVSKQRQPPLSSKPLWLDRTARLLHPVYAELLGEEISSSTLTVYAEFAFSHKPETHTA